MGGKIINFRLEKLLRENERLRRLIANVDARMVLLEKGWVV